MELKSISEQAAVLGPNGQLVQPSQNLGSTAATQLSSNEESSVVHENYVICSICTCLLLFNTIISLNFY